MKTKQYVYYGHYDYESYNEEDANEYPFYYNSPTKMQDWLLKLGDLWLDKNRIIAIRVLAPLGTRIYLNNQPYPVVVQEALTGKNTGYGLYTLNIQEPQSLINISFDREDLLDIGYYNAKLRGKEHLNDWRKILVEVDYGG